MRRSGIFHTEWKNGYMKCDINRDVYFQNLNEVAESTWSSKHIILHCSAWLGEDFICGVTGICAGSSGEAWAR